ncbi:Hypothetical protein R9X50_00115800 [Acrodontium crateriforme]|uniref:Xaa-Pro aminopeptidase n=1 Tax=Acrodontium crateriforme TaxID=150365 RepID=A0AAQ3M080_9PEZI|nr:Hypothetical protein R9X50_00115800 [Acrodontium crateriforme]
MKTRLLPSLRTAIRPIPTFRTRPFAAQRCLRRSLTSAADVQFGQPIHETHPHLVESGEITPGISALEYHHRRAALASKLPPNSIAILAASELKYRSGAVFYQFHQDPNFFYLTGFNEPEALAVIEKGESDVEYTFHLFVRPKDGRAELWDGARSGVQAALDVFNADEAGNIEDIATLLPEIVNGRSEVYTDIGSRDRKPSALARLIAGTSSPQLDGMTKLLQNCTVRPLKQLMNGLRSTKSAAEIACMRRAGHISGAVITEAMRKSYTSERQLWNDLSYGFRTQGLDGEAYVPVIGGGSNALSIHYVRNDAELAQSDCVLVDAGGAYGGYITDITRTWPVSGKFNAAQRDLYAMILRVQTSCLSLCREDADMSLDKLHRVAENGLRSGLKDLGFDMSGDALDVLFPHHVGHFIGLDVHDAPGYPRTGRLRENQCITIEPGIYVPDVERWPEHFRGLGIRIEDSVCIGAERPEILTKTAAKSVEEIESLRE